MCKWLKLCLVNVNYSYDIDTELKFQHPVFIDMTLVRKLSISKLMDYKSKYGKTG